MCGGPFVEVPLDMDGRTQAREALKRYIHVAFTARDAIGESRTSLEMQLRLPVFWADLPYQFRDALKIAAQPFFTPMGRVIQEKLRKRARSKDSPEAMGTFARDIFSAILPPVDRVFLARGARDAAIRQAARQAIARYPMSALQIVRDAVEELWALHGFHDLSAAEQREVVRRFVVVCVVEFGVIAFAREVLSNGRVQKIERIRRHADAFFESGNAETRAASASPREGIEDPVREDARGVLFIDGLVDEAMRGFVSPVEEPLVQPAEGATSRPATPTGDHPPT